MPDRGGCKGLGHSIRDGCIQGRSRSYPEPVEFLLVYFFSFFAAVGLGFCVGGVLLWNFDVFLILPFDTIFYTNISHTTSR